MPFDVKCRQLADQFLEDEPELDTEKNANDLAQQIQNTIEDFISQKKGELES
jgi:hypothetical protein